MSISASDASRFLSSQGGGPSQVNQPSRLAQGFRAVTNTLEPLQLPQDILFATLAGATDGTIWEKLKDIEYRKYGDVLDFRNPELARRPVTGEQLLQAYGVEGSVAKWGGIAADLALDPLAFGTFVRAGGKAMKLAGAGEDVWKGFYRTADLLDNKIMSPVGWMPDAAKGALSKRMDDAVGAILDFTGAGGDGATSFQRIMNTRFGKSETAYTLGDMFLPKSRALDARLGVSQGAEGITAGLGIRLESQKAQQAAQNVEELVFNNIAKLDDLFGERPTKGMLGRVMGAFGKQRKAVDVTKGVPQQMRDAILQSAYEVADSRGVAYLDDVFEGATNPLAASFREAQQVAKDELGNVLAFENKLPSNARESALGRIRQVAEATGADADGVAHYTRLFDDALKVITETDAIIGFELSGYNLIKESFLEKVVSKVGADVTNPADYASALWRDVLAEGMRSGDLSKFELPGLDGVTFNGLMKDEKLFSVLDLGTFMKSLPEGHLRRSYGLFQDGTNFETYVNAIEKGRIIPTKLIDEVDLASEIDGQAGQLLGEYIANVTSATDPSRKRGLMVRQADMVNHLRENGLSARESRKAMEQLVNARAGGDVSGLVQELKDLSAKYTPSPGGVAGGSGPGSFLTQRKDLAEDTLSILGEAANPIVSLFESAQFARRQLPVREFVRNTFEIASENKLVSDVAVGKTTRLIPEGYSQFGQFAGKYVHPQLYVELHRALEKPAQRNAILSNVRNLITGGYLAGPSVLGANLAGGVFQTAALGMNPAVMVQSVLETLPDMIKHRNNPNFVFDDLAEMQAHFGVEAVTIVQNTTARGNTADDVAEAARRLAQTGIEGGFKEQLDGVMGLWKRFLDSPIKAATGRDTKVPDVFGLDAFQFSETLLKVAAYRGAKKLGMDPTKALELSRLSTFDYTEIPKSLEMTRDAGLLLFPGYPYFMLGRGVGAAIKRPAVLSVSDRVGDAVLNSQLDEDEKFQVWASLPEWLREQDAVPVQSRRDANGNKVVSVIPLNQVLPTNFLEGSGFAGLSFAESIGSGGIYRPLMEVMTALSRGDGVAPFSQKYGGEVFSEGSAGLDKAAQTAAFLYNNFAPGGLRKTLGFKSGFDVDNFSFRDDTSGLANGIFRSVVPLPGDLADLGYSFSEIQRRKPDRNLVDSLITASFRSTTPISLGGATMNFTREFESATRSHNMDLAALRRKAERAAAYGADDQIERLRREMQEKQLIFNERWGELSSAFGGG